MLDLTGCVVDLQRRLVRGADGRVTSLTTREAALLAYLARHAPRVVTREEALREVWGYHHNVLSRALDSAVARLRLKIEVDPARPDHLITEHGTGHRLVLAAEASEAPVPRPASRSLVPVAVGSVDLSTGQVLGPERDVMLCAQELSLLQALHALDGRAMGRSELERTLWGNVLERSNRLRNLVHRLRAKIERDPGAPTHLLSLRGRGYRLRLPAAADDTGRATVLAVDLTEQLAVRGLDESESAALGLWSKAAELGGYPTGVSCSQMCLVFSAPAPALSAAHRVAEALPGARLGLCVGEVRRIVHPLSGRFEYVGAPVTRALARCRQQRPGAVPALADEDVERAPDLDPRATPRRAWRCAARPSR